MICVYRWFRYESREIAASEGTIRDKFCNSNFFGVLSGFPLRRFPNTLFTFWQHSHILRLSYRTHPRNQIEKRCGRSLSIHNFLKNFQLPNVVSILVQPKDTLVPVILTAHLPEP